MLSMKALVIVSILCSLHYTLNASQLRGNDGFTVLNDDVYEYGNISETSVIKYAFQPPMVPKPLPVSPLHPKPPPIVSEIVFENKMYAKPGESYQRFGHKIASNNDLVAVGTSIAGPASKVYLFEEYYETNATVSSGWTQKGFVSSEMNKRDGFGSALDMDGSILVVGAPQDDKAGFSSGLVYMFSVSSDGLYDEQTRASHILRAPVVQKGASFGSALSLLNDTLVIGAPGATTETGPNSGVVFIFALDSQGRWLQNYQLSAAGLGSGQDRFGSAVCITNDTIAVSATGYSATVHNGGAVYLYTYSVRSDDENSGGGSWSFDTLLTPSDLTAYAFFGYTLTFLGDVGLISAYSSSGSGVVYLYERVFSVWSLQSILSPSTPSSGFNQFGASLLLKEGLVISALSASKSSSNSLVAVVGSPGDNTAGEMAGAIYLYTVKSDAGSDDVIEQQWQLAGKVTSNDSSSYSSYGQSVAVRGVDLFVGAELADSPSSLTTGMVYVETNLISYYLAVVSDNEEPVPPPSGISVLLQTVRNALVSTVGVILLACIPAAAIAVLVVLIVTRGYVFSRGHQYETAAGMDGDGNLVDKEGHMIAKQLATEKVAIGPGYSYFVNPLQLGSSGQAGGEYGMPRPDARQLRSDSVDLKMLDCLHPPPPPPHRTTPSPPVIKNSVVFALPAIVIPPHPKLVRTTSVETPGVITLESEGHTNGSEASSAEVKPAHKHQQQLVAVSQIALRQVPSLEL